MKIFCCCCFRRITVKKLFRKLLSIILAFIVFIGAVNYVVLPGNPPKCKPYHFPPYQLPSEGCWDKIGLRPFCIENLVNASVHPNATMVSISIVTQLSCQRLHLLKLLADHWWSEHMSVVLFDSNSHQCPQHAVQQAVQIATRHRKMQLNLVRSPNQDLYPFNALRHIAASKSLTTHLFYWDIDLMPSQNLYSVLMEHIQNDKWITNTTFLGPLPTANDPIAFVIPAFKFMLPNVNYKTMVIEDRNQLIQLWHQGIVHRIHSGQWWHGHAPTNFSHWKICTTDYEILYKDKMEPYVLVERSAPKPDYRFVGAHSDKLASTAQLNAQGYRFIVIRNGFVVHVMHNKSYSMDLRDHYKRCNRQLYQQLVAELQQQTVQ